MPADNVVTLGEQEYALIPQKHTYLKRRLGELFEALQDRDLAGGGSLLDLVGDNLYEVCRVFIPGLMSREAWEDDDTAPTFPQIEHAITMGLKVNGLQRVGMLGKIISPDLLRALIQQQMAEVIASSMSSNLRSLPPRSGGSGPTNGSTTDPTSTPPAPSDGPSSESTGSSPLESPAGEPISAT